MMNIYVGNLSYNATEEQLQELFERFGNVESVKIIMDKMTGKAKGFAFVQMASATEAQAAINELNGQEFSGRSLRVNQAREREARPPRSPRY